MNVTLHLWISNQLEGQGFDATGHYLQATGWTAPTGITLDVDAQTLSGEANACWTACRSLAQAVAAKGHGLDTTEEETETGEPRLTACPQQLIESGYTCAAESLARLNSSECKTWAAFVASVPSLAKELTQGD